MQFGLLICLLAVFVLVLLMIRPNRLNRNANSRLALNVSTIFMVVFLYSSIAYHTYCTRYTDAIRMSSEMADSKTQGLLYLLGKYDANPLSAIYLYLVAQVGGMRVLQMISCAVYMGILLYTLLMIGEGESRIALTAGVFYLICLLDLSAPLDNVRFPVATVIFCGSVLLYYFSNKNIFRMIMICLLACLMHFSLWPIFMLILVALTKKKVIIILASIVSVSNIYIMRICEPLINSISPTVAWKMDSYFNYNSQYYVNIISRSQIMFSVMVLLFAGVMCIYWNSVSKSTYSGTLLLTFSYVIGCLPSPVAFARMVPLVVILSVAPLMQLTNYEVDSISKQYGKSTTFMYLLVLISFMFLCLALRCSNTYEPYYIA